MRVLLVALLLLPVALADRTLDGTLVCDRVIGYRQIDASIVGIRLDDLNEAAQREAYDQCERNIGDIEAVIPLLP